MNDSAIDKALKINTMGRDDYKADDYHHPYEPTPYSVLERLVQSGYITGENIVVDYGCGKGRVDFYLTDRLGCYTIGVEYDERIYEIALENRRLYKGKLYKGLRDREMIRSGNQSLDIPKSPEFVCIKAEEYIIEDADCFYFFNPFTVDILQSVLGKIRYSYYENPREMKLFFYYPDDAYISYLMTREELLFVDEIDCRDLFAGNNSRERIMIFEVM